MKSILSRRDLLGTALLGGGSLLLPAEAAAPQPLTELAAAPPATPGDRQQLLAYFAKHAPDLLRPSMGVLHYPSVSPSLPGNTYDTSLWDWDTLWTVRGLFQVAARTHDGKLKEQIAEHARGSIANFFDHQSAEGRIPMLISVRDPDPLGCLKGTAPHKENQAKPVLAQPALLVAEETGNADWFRPYFPRLLAFYESWTRNNLSRTGLLVWGDDVAIGNDNDPTTFGRPFFSSANLLLNCLYYQDLKAATDLARRLGLAPEQESLQKQADTLGTAIQTHCWDPRDGFYYTVDVQCVDQRATLIPNIPRGMDMSWDSLPLRIQTFTGFLPLWCKLATRQQAAALLSHLQDPHTFGAAYGVRTLSASERMYSLAKSSNPSNWLGPVWIIANYFAWKGLTNYGFTEAAAALASSTVALLARDLAGSGSLNEYYHPDTGAPLSHRGFMDWNLLVLEMF